MATGTRTKTAVSEVFKLGDKKRDKDACLVVIHGLELGRKYNLGGDSVVIGRSSKADVRIDQESVSRSHAKIMNTGKSIILRDLGSTNGTHVNDQLIDEYVLRDGDFIKIGRTIFKFLSGGNIENAYHEEIYRLTTIDGLTQVFNRRYFLDQLEREIARAKRYHRDLSLLMLDIDRFKEVNDRYGHLAGDELLRQLAGVIKAKVRREDVLARYGGEEFVIILPELDGASAVTCGEKLRALVEGTRFQFEEKRLAITISLGMASCGEADDAALLIKRADDKLYEAKAAGRNCLKS